MPPEAALFTEPPAPPPPPMDWRKTALALSPMVWIWRSAIWRALPRVTEPAEPPPPPVPPVEPEAPSEKEELEEEVATLLPMIEPPAPPPPPMDWRRRPWAPVPEARDTLPVVMVRVSGTEKETLRPDPPPPPVPPMPKVADAAKVTFPEAAAELVTEPPAPPPPPTDWAKKP